MNVIMPVVGEGRRFRAAGYTMLKPFIPIQGRMMIQWALDPIPKSWDVCVICKEEDRADFVSRVALIEKAERPKIRLMNLLGPTQGAACTVLAAVMGLPKNDPVAVVNCDQWFWFDKHNELEFLHGLGELHNYALSREWDGFILTFTGDGTRWSYVKTDENGFVRATAEKEVISNQATVGFYWFRRAGDLFRAICDMISSNIKTNNEFYLCPVYNELIWRYRHKVKAVPVQEFWGLGTPEDVNKFAREFPLAETSVKVSAGGNI